MVLKAIAKGAQQTAAQTAGGISMQVQRNLPDVQKAVYSLGMGMGPFIQNVVSELKDSKEKKKDSNTGNDENKTVGIKQFKESFSILSNQMKSMVSLLQDIKMIGMSQLNATQKVAYERRKKLYEEEERQMELLKPSVSATPVDTSSKQTKGGLGDLFGGLFKFLGSGSFLATLIGGGLAAAGIWSLLDDETKKQIKGAIGNVVDTLINNIFKEVGNFIVNNPALAAGIATLLAPRLAASLVLGASKFLFPSTSKPTTPPPVQGPAPTGTRPPTTPPVISTPQTMPGGETKPSQRYGGGPGSLTIEGQQKQTPSSTPQPQAPEQKGTKGMLGKFGGLLGKLIAPLSALYTGVQAHEEYKQGNMLTSGLYGTSAALAAGAMVPTVASPFLFAGSVATGLLGSIASMFNAKPETKPPTKPIEAPPPSATGAADPFAGIRMGTESQARERVGGGATAIGMLDLARKMQESMPNIKEFTAFNDETHQQDKYRGSVHRQGRAMDFTLKDPSKSQQAVEELKKILESAGLKTGEYKILDEYKNPSPGATAGHVHLELRNLQAANKLAMALGGRQREQLAAQSMVTPNQTKALAPTQVATQDTQTGAEVSSLMDAMSEYTRAIMTGGLDGGGGGGGGDTRNVNISSSSDPAPIIVSTTDTTQLMLNKAAVHQSGISAIFAA